MSMKTKLSIELTSLVSSKLLKNLGIGSDGQPLWRNKEWKYLHPVIVDSVLGKKGHITLTPEDIDAAQVGHTHEFSDTGGFPPARVHNNAARRDREIQRVAQRKIIGGTDIQTDVAVLNRTRSSSPLFRVERRTFNRIIPIPPDMSDLFVYKFARYENNTSRSYTIPFEKQRANGNRDMFAYVNIGTQNRSFVVNSDPNNYITHPRNVTFSGNSATLANYTRLNQQATPDNVVDKEDGIYLKSYELQFRPSDLNSISIGRVPLSVEAQSIVGSLKHNHTILTSRIQDEHIQSVSASNWSGNINNVVRHSTRNASGSISSTSNTNNHIQVTLKTPTVVNAVAMYTSTSSDVREFSVLGSNDNVNWETITTQSNPYWRTRLWSSASWQLAGNRVYYFSNSTAYTHYRITPRSTSTMAILRLFLFRDLGEALPLTSEVFNSRNAVIPSFLTDMTQYPTLSKGDRNVIGYNKFITPKQFSILTNNVLTNIPDKLEFIIEGSEIAERSNGILFANNKNIESPIIEEINFDVHGFKQISLSAPNRIVKICEFSTEEDFVTVEILRKSFGYAETVFNATLVFVNSEGYTYSLDLHSWGRLNKSLIPQDGTLETSLTSTAMVVDRNTQWSESTPGAIAFDFKNNRILVFSNSTLTSFSSYNIPIPTSNVVVDGETTTVSDTREVDAFSGDSTWEVFLTTYPVGHSTVRDLTPDTSISLDISVGMIRGMYVNGDFETLPHNIMRDVLGEIELETPDLIVGGNTSSADRFCVGTIELNHNSMFEISSFYQINTTDRSRIVFVSPNGTSFSIDCAFLWLWGGDGNDNKDLYDASSRFFAGGSISGWNTNQQGKVVGLLLEKRPTNDQIRFRIYLDGSNLYNSSWYTIEPSYHLGSVWEVYIEGGIATSRHVLHNGKNVRYGAPNIEYNNIANYPFNITSSGLSASDIIPTNKRRELYTLTTRPDNNTVIRSITDTTPESALISWSKTDSIFEPLGIEVTDSTDKAIASELEYDFEENIGTVRADIYPETMSTSFPSSARDDSNNSSYVVYSTLIDYEEGKIHFFHDNVYNGTVNVSDISDDKLVLDVYVRHSYSRHLNDSTPLGGKHLVFPLKLKNKNIENDEDVCVVDTYSPNTTQVWSSRWRGTPSVTYYSAEYDALMFYVQARTYTQRPYVRTTFDDIVYRSNKMERFGYMEFYISNYRYVNSTYDASISVRLARQSNNEVVFTTSYSSRFSKGVSSFSPALQNDTESVQHIFQEKYENNIWIPQPQHKELSSSKVNAFKVYNNIPSRIRAIEYKEDGSFNELFNRVIDPSKQPYNVLPQVSEGSSIGFFAEQNQDPRITALGMEHVRSRATYEGTATVINSGDDKTSTKLTNTVLDTTTQGTFAIFGVDNGLNITLEIPRFVDSYTLKYNSALMSPKKWKVYTALEDTYTLVDEVSLEEFSTEYNGSFERTFADSIKIEVEEFFETTNFRKTSYISASGTSSSGMFEYENYEDKELINHTLEFEASEPSTNNLRSFSRNNMTLAALVSDSVWVYRRNIFTGKWYRTDTGSSVTTVNNVHTISVTNNGRYVCVCGRGVSVYDTHTRQVTTIDTKSNNSTLLSFAGTRFTNEDFMYIFVQNQFLENDINNYPGTVLKLEIVGGEFVTSIIDTEDSIILMEGSNSVSTTNQSTRVSTPYISEDGSNTTIFSLQTPDLKDLYTFNNIYDTENQRLYRNSLESIIPEIVDIVNVSGYKESGEVEYLEELALDMSLLMPLLAGRGDTGVYNILEIDFVSYFNESSQHILYSNTNNNVYISSSSSNFQINGSSNISLLSDSNNLINTKLSLYINTNNTFTCTVRCTIDNHRYGTFTLLNSVASSAILSFLGSLRFVNLHTISVGIQRVTPNTMSGRSLNGIVRDDIKDTFRSTYPVINFSGEDSYVGSLVSNQGAKFTFNGDVKGASVKVDDNIVLDIDEDTGDVIITPENVSEVTATVRDSINIPSVSTITAQDVVPLKLIETLSKFSIPEGMNYRRWRTVNRKYFVFEDINMCLNVIDMETGELLTTVIPEDNEYITSISSVILREDGTQIAYSRSSVLYVRDLTQEGNPVLLRHEDTSTITNLAFGSDYVVYTTSLRVKTVIIDSGIERYILNYGSSSKSLYAAGVEGQYYLLRNSTDSRIMLYTMLDGGLLQLRYNRSISIAHANFRIIRHDSNYIWVLMWENINIYIQRYTISSYGLSTWTQSCNLMTATSEFDVDFWIRSNNRVLFSARSDQDRAYSSTSQGHVFEFTGSSIRLITDNSASTEHNRFGEGTTHLFVNDTRTVLVKVHRSGTATGAWRHNYVCYDAPEMYEYDVNNIRERTHKLGIFRYNPDSVRLSTDGRFISYEDALTHIVRVFDTQTNTFIYPRNVSFDSIQRRSDTFDFNAAYRNAIKHVWASNDTLILFNSSNYRIYRNILTTSETTASHTNGYWLDMHSYKMSDTTGRVIYTRNRSRSNIQEWNSASLLRGISFLNQSTFHVYNSVGIGNENFLGSTTPFNNYRVIYYSTYLSNNDSNRRETSYLVASISSRRKRIEPASHNIRGFIIDDVSSNLIVFVYTNAHLSSSAHIVYNHRSNYSNRGIRYIYTQSNILSIFRDYETDNMHVICTDHYYVLENASSHLLEFKHLDFRSEFEYCSRPMVDTLLLNSKGTDFRGRTVLKDDGEMVHNNRFACYDTSYKLLENNKLVLPLAPHNFVTGNRFNFGEIKSIQVQTIGNRVRFVINDTHVIPAFCRDSMRFNIPINITTKNGTVANVPISINPIQYMSTARHLYYSTNLLPVLYTNRKLEVSNKEQFIDLYLDRESNTFVSKSSKEQNINLERGVIHSWGINTRKDIVVSYINRSTVANSVYVFNNTGNSESPEYLKGLMLSDTFNVTLSASDKVGINEQGDVLLGWSNTVRRYRKELNTERPKSQITLRNVRSDSNSNTSSSVIFASRAGEE